MAQQEWDSVVPYFKKNTPHLPLTFIPASSTFPPLPIDEAQASRIWKPCQIWHGQKRPLIHCYCFLFKIQCYKIKRDDKLETKRIHPSRPTLFKHDNIKPPTSVYSEHDETRSDQV